MKRFNTANEIRDEIETYQAKAKNLELQAEMYEESSKKYARDPLMKEHAAWEHMQSKKMRRAAARIREKKLVFLRHKLSEFLTPPIPGLIPEGDRSISRKG